MPRQALIQLRRGTGLPANNALAEGELAIDISAKKLYSANSTGYAFTLSGDQYNLAQGGNSSQGTVTLNVDNNSLSNDSVTFAGTGGITISGNSTQMTFNAAAGTDYDLSAGGTAATGTIVLGGDADTDTVTLSGNNGLVVSNTSTTAVLVENKGSQHTVTVAGGKFVIDGTSQQALRLVPGMIYWFDQSDNTNSNHPFVFGTAANGSEVSQGTASGFEIYEKEGTPGNAGSYTRIKLQQDAPNHVYYFCSNHSGMGGSAYIQPDNVYSNASHFVSTDPIISEGSLTVGNSTVNAVLSTAGALDLDSNLTVAGLSTLTGNVTASDSLTVADGITVTGGHGVSVGNSTVNVFMTTGGNVTADGHISAGGDVDIVGEVNAASAAITGAAVIGTTLASGNVTATGFVNATTTIQAGGLITGGAGLDITGLANVSGNALFSDTVGIADGLNVTGGTVTIGNSTVNAVITQAGNINTDGTLTVAGTSDLNGNLEVAGLSTLTGNTIMSDDATVGGDLTVSGNLTVSGTQTIVSSTTVALTDSLLKLAKDQTGTDTDAVDIGFYGVFDAGGTDKYSGLFRDTSDSNKKFVLVEGITSEPTTTVSYTASNLAYLEAIIDGGTY